MIVYVFGCCDVVLLVVGLFWFVMLCLLFEDKMEECIDEGFEEMFLVSDLFVVGGVMCIDFVKLFGEYECCVLYVFFLFCDYG